MPKLNKIYQGKQPRGKVPYKAQWLFLFTVLYILSGALAQWTTTYAVFVAIRLTAPYISLEKAETSWIQQILGAEVPGSSWQISV